MKKSISSGITFDDLGRPVCFGVKASTISVGRFNTRQERPSLVTQPINGNGKTNGGTVITEAKRKNVQQRHRKQRRHRRALERAV